VTLSDAETLQIINTYSCTDSISQAAPPTSLPVRHAPALNCIGQVEWAPDSQHVMCTMLKKGVVQVNPTPGPEFLY